MSIIVPAILPVSRKDLVDKLEQLVGLVDEVQIDIVDGVFASPPTWPYDSGPEELTRMLASGDMIPHSGECRVEVDLMVAHPEATAGAWIELGASRVTVHATRSDYVSRLLNDFATVYGHEKGFASGLLAIGLAIPADSDPEAFAQYFDQLDYVQFMGIKNVGRQGEPFDAGVLKAIALFRRRHPDMPVQVDGGVSIHTAAKLLELGVSRLVVGSALWQAPDFQKALSGLEELTQERGIYE